MNRRNFLKLAAGGTVVLATGTWASFGTATGRTWKWVKLTGFKQAERSHRWVGQIIGLRSDDVYFYTAGVIPADDFTPRRVDDTIKSMQYTFDTFRDCACVYGTACPLHQEMFPPDDSPPSPEDERVPIEVA